jgi:hypothetical protein
LERRREHRASPCRFTRAVFKPCISANSRQNFRDDSPDTKGYRPGCPHCVRGQCPNLVLLENGGVHAPAPRCRDLDVGQPPAYGRTRTSAALAGGTYTETVLPDVV